MWMYIVFKEVQKCVCQITETFKVHCPEYFFFFHSHTKCRQLFSQIKVSCEPEWRRLMERWQGQTDQRRMDTTGLRAFFPVVLFEFKFNLTIKIGWIFKSGPVSLCRINTKQNWKQSHLTVAVYLLALSQLKATVVFFCLFVLPWGVGISMQPMSVLS